MRTRIGIGILVFLSLVLLLFGMSGEEGPAGSDAPVPAMLEANPSDIDQERALRGTAVLGMVVFSLGLILGGVRRGQRWAWWCLWYWPVFLVLHVIAFDTYVPDLPLAALAAIGLLLARPPSQPEPATT